jgi:phosphatidylserine decarboxylase
MSPGVWLQHVVPQKLLSQVVLAATRWRWRPWKDLLIRAIARIYRIDVNEAASTQLGDYPHFNAFFTRALKPGARPLDADPGSVLMPADGHISQLGPIEAGTIFQAKGHSYTAAALLGDEAAAAPFHDGVFATVYLSPRDYHRVHSPLAGRLRETRHVPGRLFSVSPATVAEVPGLFARNERLVCLFDTDHGPMAVVLVGAMLVSGVETVWGGVEIPPYAKNIVTKDYRATSPPIALGRGAELGRFNMGSTVILLLPKGFSLNPALGEGAPVKMGQGLGRAPAAAGAGLAKDHTPP